MLYNCDVPGVVGSIWEYTNEEVESPRCSMGRIQARLKQGRQGLFLPLHSHSARHVIRTK